MEAEMKTNILYTVGYTGAPERRRLHARFGAAAQRPAERSATARASVRTTPALLRAVWRLSPVTGRPEMHWVAAPAPAPLESCDLPAAAA